MRTERAPDGFRNLIPCGLCGCEFQFGPHRYAGRKVVAWNLMICELCDRMNHDGLVPQSHPELMQRLMAQGVTLERLPGGFVRIPPLGQ